MRNGRLEITWISIPIAPDSILSFINCGCKTGCSTNRCSCKKAGLKCSDLCKCEGCENSTGKDSLDDEEDIDYNQEICNDDGGSSESDIESESESGSDSEDEGPISEWKSSAYTEEECIMSE